MTDHEKGGIGRIIGGIVCVLSGLFIYLWARGHSPHMGFVEMLMKLDSYYIEEPFYILIILIAAGLGLAGLVLLFLGVMTQTKR